MPPPSAPIPGVYPDEAQELAGFNCVHKPTRSRLVPVPPSSGAAGQRCPPASAG
ncbi:hypothetical protein T492DRAFT_876285 [Pavlovales sp. CCMP2436]|nr:hypothetical protein T492DRAFT_876285 [Pavlovales sp. CCMP2436]